MMLWSIVACVAFIVLAPFVGGIIAGADRIITARMQGRVGPPILQPFYDVLKLLEKEDITVNRVQDFYVFCFFLFIVVTGGLFFSGSSLLLVIFAFTLASVFLIVAAFSSNSPYAQIGAERELLQLLAYEPMVLLTAVGFYLATGSFNVSDIMTAGEFPLPKLIGIFLGFVYILTIKLRKSPFDLSMSHHAHQELVKGLTTEFSGKTLAWIEISHWYENVLLLGMIFIFFVNGTWLFAGIGLVACILIYIFEILIDNSFARMKWQFTLNSAWIVAIILGGINLVVLLII
ncbi:MAG: respiratory chain complex I subunit 1 family protein [Anaerovoracaceae bacterium]